MTSTRSTETRHRLGFDLSGALLGGAVTTLGLFGGIVAVGRVGTFRALRLIEAVVPTAQFFAAAVVGAGATVLALMLTLLALTFSSEWRFTGQHFRRVRQVTVLAISAIVMATLVLVSLSVPIEEVDELRTWYAGVYYVLAGACSLLGGVVVAMALMIGITIQGLIDIGHPEGSSALIEQSSSGRKAPEAGSARQVGPDLEPAIDRAR